MIIRKQATVDRLEGKQVVLVLENKQELVIAKDELGDIARPGDAFAVHILPADEAALNQEDLARSILNQLLDHEGDSR